VLDAEAKVEKEVLIDDAIVSGCEEGEDVWEKLFLAGR
jgi:hypothetical protein